MAKQPDFRARPRQRKTDIVADRALSQAFVAKPADRRQLELFDDPFPGWIEPCKPVLVKKPPAGDHWQHEIKWDGYRLSVYLLDGQVTIRSSHGHDFTGRFPSIAKAVAALPVRSAVIDGEVVVLDERGRSNFGDLQAAMTRGGGRQAVMFAFDLLFYDGMDLRPWKLDARRAVLEGLIGDGHGTALVLSQEFEGHGGDIFAHACRLGLEGIVSKRRDRPYRSGKCEDWVKTKCVMSDEFVIIGYQPSSAFRGMLGAIHVATMLADRLHYAGAVGSGFSEKAARGLKSRLDKLVSQTPVISNLKIKDAVWCRPEIRAEIAYRDVTREGMLRHASFKSIVGDDSGA